MLQHMPEAAVLFSFVIVEEQFYLKEEYPQYFLSTSSIVTSGSGVFCCGANIAIPDLEN